jgi:hypothetical protein
MVGWSIILNALKQRKRALGDCYGYLFFGDTSRRDETIIADLTAGCLRITAVTCHDTLCFDIFVKDDPTAAQWIFYESLPRKNLPSLRKLERELFTALDEIVTRDNLSYTTSTFKRLPATCGAAPRFAAAPAIHSKNTM